ncbi:MAG: hypothetical protein HY698_09835 [Deltaproteobacteria bacterium]|nr:hypothetical protein [Deltaproteobacteria bacterium]
MASAGELIGLEAGFARRSEGWKHQRKLAEEEFKQLERQVEAARLRVQIAERALALHEKAVEQQDERLELLDGKFTSLGLYTWLSTQLRRSYREAYQNALSLARLAEEAFRFERGEEAAPGFLRRKHLELRGKQPGVSPVQPAPGVLERVRSALAWTTRHAGADRAQRPSPATCAPGPRAVRIEGRAASANRRGVAWDIPGQRGWPSGHGVHPGCNPWESPRPAAPCGLFRQPAGSACLDHRRSGHPCACHASPGRYVSRRCGEAPGRAALPRDERGCVRGALLHGATPRTRSCDGHRLAVRR